MKSSILIGVACLGIGAACGASQQKHILESAADSSSKERHTAFEATARMLDERPEYVDEFYAIVRQHPRTLERFMSDTTDDLEREDLAHTQGDILTDRPKSLEAVMAQVIETSKNKKEARLAFARVIDKKAWLVSDIVADRESTTVAVMNATIAIATKRKTAAEAMHASMKTSAPKLAQVLAQDHETVRILAKELVKYETK